MRRVSIAVLLDRYLQRKRSAIVDFILANEIICPQDILPEHIKHYEEKLLDSYSSANARRFKLDTVRDFLRCLRFTDNRWTLQ